MRGKIIGVDGGGTLYRIWMETEDSNILTIPVEHRYFSRIVEETGDMIGREIEYRDDCIYFAEDGENT